MRCSILGAVRLFKRLKEALRQRKTAEDRASKEAAPEPDHPRGKSYWDGAYRLHEASDIPHFTSLAVDAFPEFEGRISCFGADWSGRQFATDNERLVDGEPQVLLLEPGTGEVLRVPASFASFHEEELIQYPDAAVGYSFFKEWLASGGRSPAYDQCVGYKRPLYLGGDDTVANLELSDFDVYWSLCAQLLEQVRGLPVGTPVRVSIGD